jgi:hypothetical protein
MGALSKVLSFFHAASQEIRKEFRNILLPVQEPDASTKIKKTDHQAL